MLLEWQQIVVLACVAFSAAYLANRIRLALRRRSSGACAGCARCPSLTATQQAGDSLEDLEESARSRREPSAS